MASLVKKALAKKNLTACFKTYASKTEYIGMK